MQGDINCDNDITSVDALLILRHVAGLPVNLPADCPGLGQGGIPLSTNAAGLGLERVPANAGRGA